MLLTYHQTILLTCLHTGKRETRPSSNEPSVSKTMPHGEKLSPRVHKIIAFIPFSSYPQQHPTVWQPANQGSFPAFASCGPSTAKFHPIKSPSGVQSLTSITAQASLRTLLTIIHPQIKPRARTLITADALHFVFGYCMLPSLRLPPHNMSRNEVTRNSRGIIVTAFLRNHISHPTQNQ
jgi:hypothetical protein